MNDGDHPVLTAVGLAAVALGVLMVVEPGVAAAIGVDYVAVIVVGMLALVQGVRVARARRASEIRGAETPDVETVETMPTPGDEFDQRVAALDSGPRRTRIRERADLREILEDAAVTAIADRENCSREQAVERIESGTWTDDRHAASFLGESGAPRPPFFERMKVVASTESTFQYNVRRTADAIAHVAGVTDDGADEDASETERDVETTTGTEHKRSDGSAIDGWDGSRDDAASDEDTATDDGTRDTDIDDGTPRDGDTDDGTPRDGDTDEREVQA